MAEHLYIHIPFCEAKCPYCDFYSVADTSHSAFFDALEHEIRSMGGDTLSTVYIGGGTPSFPDAAHIVRTLDTVREVFDIADDAEITIEANPHSLTPYRAEAYRDAGINRISLGVQSLHDEVLKTLGRLHDRDTALKTAGYLTRIFDNVSADLMLGIPGQTADMLINDAGTLIGLGVKHISMYSLMIEVGTEFYDRYNGRLDDLVPDERVMYHCLRDYLDANGLHPYEISNCAYEGYESRHNISYWRGEEYYAAGPSAHGYLDRRRFSHKPSVAGYIKDPLATDTEEILSDEDRMREYGMLMLRTSEGIDRAVFLSRFGRSADDVFGDAIAENTAKGLLSDNGMNIFLTRRGLDFANQVFADLL